VTPRGLSYHNETVKYASGPIEMAPNQITSGIVPTLKPMPVNRWIIDKTDVN